MRRGGTTPPLRMERCAHPGAVCPGRCGCRPDELRRLMRDLSQGLTWARGFDPAVRLGPGGQSPLTTDEWGTLTKQVTVRRRSGVKVRVVLYAKAPR
ncbi:hypothetical protein DPEC_G00299940 [Dallia pectoralis]|uniref:Uncharacterized protein n=1 Tax=Dallia pectoralis TaxID=75939 RepID=A0ACC2FGA9_DALPE|nr:hypothetical protein DPEC_G00299940 [Dallia pectoralis]